MTDEKLNELLVRELKKVVSLVREGVYTGDDVDVYIVFSYYVRGVFHSNDRPSGKTWSINVTLWARKGVPVYNERDKLKEVIESFSDSYPSLEVATDDGWQQYIYEFEYTGGVEEWQKL